LQRESAALINTVGAAFLTMEELKLFVLVVNYIKELEIRFVPSKD
jgi:hypothetical protein